MTTGQKNWDEIRSDASEFLDNVSKTDFCKTLASFVGRIHEKLKGEGIAGPFPLPDDGTVSSAYEKINKFGNGKRLQKYLFACSNEKHWWEALKTRTKRTRSQNEIIDDFLEYENNASDFFEEMVGRKPGISSAETLKTVGTYTEAESIADEKSNIVFSNIDLQKYSDSVCEKFLHNNSSKYRKEVFEDREAFKKKYNSFVSSSNNFFLLLGESGVGKTNIVCNVVEIEREAKEKNNLVFAYDSNGLDEKSLKEIAGYLPAIQEKIEEKSIQAIFIFDAINEATGYSTSKLPFLDLLKDIDALILKEKHDHIKVLVSCRTFSWRDVIQYNLPKFSFILTDENQVEIEYFTEKELLAAYPKYQKSYDLHNSLQEIETDAYATVRKSLRNPLQLRWIAEAYKGKPLPQSETQLNYEHLCFEKLEQLKAIDRRVYELIYHISKYLFENKAHSLNESDLFDNRDEDLHKIRLLLIDDKSEYTPAGRLLIDANFLKKDAHFAYRFEFEKIQEAMFAHVFLREQSKKYRDKIIPVQEYMNVYAEKEHDVVFNNFLRDAFINDFKEKGYNYATIKDLALTNDAGMQKLAYLTLSKLMRQHYNTVYEIIESIIDDDAFMGFASKTTIDLISDLFIPSIYEQSTGNDKKPVALLQKMMFHAGKNPQIANQLGLNTYIITRRNQKRAEEIMNELFHFALTQNQLSIEYLIQLGILTFVLSVDTITTTPTKDTDPQNNLDFVIKNILHPWKIIVKRIFSKELKVTGPGPKVLWRIINHLPLFIRNRTLKIFIKLTLMRFGGVQSDFVNNLAEFKRFWTDVPKQNSKGWSQKDYKSLTSYLDPQKNDIQSQKSKIIAGYQSNNAFSYFLLERVLIVQGITNWNNISGIIDEIRQLDNLTDYSKMSVAYVLFHIIEKSDKFNEPAFQILSKIAKEWSSSTKGKFSIVTHGEKGKKYKQFILNWYFVAYFKWHDYRKIDWTSSVSINENIPEFIELVDEAFAKNDKDLLFHILENIAIVATDFGYTDIRYIEAAIRLFDYIVKKMDTKEKIINFKTSSQSDNNKDLSTVMCGVLCTMQNYFPQEVSGYLEAELFSNLESPLVQEIREKMSLMNFEFEGLGGLLTHRTGNLIVWICKNHTEARNVFMDVLKNACQVHHANQWAYRMIEYCVEKLLDVKL